MSRISVRLFAGAAEALNATEVMIEGPSTLAGLLTELAAGEERRREVLDQCSFFVDGEHRKDLEAHLPGDCRVDVLPPFAGG